MKRQDDHLFNELFLKHLDQIYPGASLSDDLVKSAYVAWHMCHAATYQHLVAIHWMFEEAIKQCRNMDLDTQKKLLPAFDYLEMIEDMYRKYNLDFPENKT